MASQHDSASCPELLREQQARLDAARVFGQAQTIAADQQGVAGFVDLEAEDLPSSTELMSGQAIDSATIFGDELTARKYREVLLPTTGQQDGTIPRTPAQKRAHVRVLFKAFKSVPQNSEEGAKMKEKFIKEDHNNHLVEVMCWELLEDCIRRAGTTENLVEAWEPGKARGKNEHWTFAERFDHLAQAMATSKSICKHLFDVPFRVKLVDDPLRSSKRVASNRLLNQKKAESLKRGRQAEKEDEKSAKRSKREQTTGAQVDNNLASQTTQQLAPPATPQPMATQRRPLGMQQPQTPQMQLSPAPRAGSRSTSMQDPNMGRFQSMQGSHTTAFIPTGPSAPQHYYPQALNHGAPHSQPPNFPYPGSMPTMPHQWNPYGRVNLGAVGHARLSIGSPAAEPTGSLPQAQLFPHQLLAWAPDSLLDPNVNFQRDLPVDPNMPDEDPEFHDDFPQQGYYDTAPSSMPQGRTNSSGSTQSEGDYQTNPQTNSNP
ncbi:hypothetical protein A1O3_00885 [Capronia epimyces CBS 606.96]|uniref:Uncharacterized protein n=1 Tax=Capronia epimyces CBS 606.96 TaxID=1182542 RepID=W9YRS9_9EURO|nr:uncharacterized protein A1O3_00885 [Capronia epimyces CBS 606.96]EXJ92335.1 hypothetical protein A1O3_00885 [Capronia epimyces CBS 606.96]